MSDTDNDGNRDDETVKKSTEPAQQQPETVEKEKIGLDAFQALAQANSHYEGRVQQLRKFHGILKRKGFTDTDSIRCVIFLYTSGRTNRRRDLTEQQLLTLNTLLENCSSDEINRIIDSVREKMLNTA